MECDKDKMQVLLYPYHLIHRTDYHNLRFTGKFYRSIRLRGLAQGRRDEILSSKGILRGGIPAQAITSLMHAMKHVMTVYKVYY